MFDSGLYKRNKIYSYAINAENPTGGRGCGGRSASPLGVARKGSPCFRNVRPGEVVTLADIKGTGKITHIWATVDDRTSDSERFVLRDLVLRMYWDGEAYPSVEVPLGDFFCNGFGETYLVESIPVSVVPSRGFNCFFPMPFGKSALITLENQHAEDIPAFFYQIDYTLGDDVDEDTFYFHARWRRENPTMLKKDYTVLDDVRGEGAYIGTFIAMSTLSRYWYGEGEMKFYLDGDSDFPTICGTGMEDYFGGSWSFAKQDGGKTVERTFNSPFLGYPFYSRHDENLHNNYHNDDCPPMRAFYRWHLMDPVYFKKDIRVTLQQIGVCHKGLFERQDDLSSVAYWYQSEPHVAFPALVPVEERWPR